MAWRPWSSRSEELRGGRRPHQTQILLGISNRVDQEKPTDHPNTRTPGHSGHRTRMGRAMNEKSPPLAPHDVNKIPNVLHRDGMGIPFALHEAFSVQRMPHLTIPAAVPTVRRRAPHQPARFAKQLQHQLFKNVGADFLHVTQHGRVAGNTTQGSKNFSCLPNVAPMARFSPKNPRVAQSNPGAPKLIHSAHRRTGSNVPLTMSPSRSSGRRKADALG